MEVSFGSVTVTDIIMAKIGKARLEVDFRYMLQRVPGTRCSFAKWRIRRTSSTVQIPHGLIGKEIGAWPV